MTEGSSSSAAASSAPSKVAAEIPKEGATPEASKQVSVPASAANRGVDLLTTPDGEVMGFSISAAAQVYQTLERITGMRRVLALPVSERYALAGKVASVPDEHARIAERLASAVGTSFSEAGALNALYVLETCQELVPGFREHLAEDRLAKAAELSPHARVQAAVLKGEKPPEWERAAQAAPSSIVLLPQDDDDEDDEEPGLLYDAGRAVGDATKFVGGAALGGVGLVTDTLGITRDAENALADGAEDAVDLVGDGVHAVVSTFDDGLEGTAHDLAQKGVVGAVGDGVADAVDMVSDFVGDTVTGIADGVQDLLGWATGEEAAQQPAGYATHRLIVSVAELFGEQRSLGLLLENRVVTKFTKPEAEKLGFRLGDSVAAVGAGLVHTQEEMLAAIAAAKESLKANGTPIRFLVERLGPAPGQ